MAKFPINLEDLVPQEVSFKLSTLPEKTFTLCRWSLRVRTWAIKKYGHKGLQLIFDTLSIEEIAEMAWFMLKNKDEFPGGPEEFFDSIVNVADHKSVITAMVGTLGIGEPEIKKINESLGGQVGAPPAKADPEDPKPKAPNKKIGAKSLTP